jgi:Rrf2 family protein
LQSPGDSMLSLTAEYALRAVLALARMGAGAALRSNDIADRTGAPRNYMSKTLNALAREGILASRRGPAGGFSLRVAPSDLTVERIARPFSAERPAARCLLGDRWCDPFRPCAAHGRWTAVLDAARAPLSVTIAELLRDDDVELGEWNEESTGGSGGGATPVCAPAQRGAR